MIAMEDWVLAVESSKTGWKKVYESLKGTHPQCIAFDPNNPNRAYCGTFGGGLWKTDDGGQSWDSIGKKQISSSDVMSVSVSSLEKEKIATDSIQYMWELNLAPSIDLMMEEKVGIK